MGVSCHEAHVQQQQVCSCPLPACSCRPSLQHSCRAPFPGEKGRGPSGAEQSRQPGPASWSLRASGLKEEVEKGGEVSGMASLRAEQGGAAQPELLLASFTIPIPARPGAPQCWVLHRCCLCCEENVLFGVCHMQLRAPAHVRAVLSDMHTCGALRTLTIDTARYSHTPARHRAKCSPPPWGGPLHAALNHPPPHAWLPA